MSEQFWEACEPLMAAGSIVEGTIMGGECARTQAGEFVAMPHHKGPGIVVKLTRARVAELTDAGVGEPFAPAKKVFKEWVLVRAHDHEQWQGLLVESVEFVS